jgi:ABC-type branched-subunit amino acid transport system ATPase component
VHVLSKGRVVYSAEPQTLWENEEVKANYLGI